MKSFRPLAAVALSIILLSACQPARRLQSGPPTAGIYKVEIFYPAGEGKTFDMNYYEQKHMPMIAAIIGNNLQSYQIDQGISGRTPTDKPLYMAIGTFYVINIEVYNKAIAQNRDAITNDFKNYTNVQPMIQVSQVSKMVLPATRN